MSRTRQCEFCDKELPDQAEFDACESCIKVMAVLINDPPVRTIQPEDGWGDCTTCGQLTGSADLWQDTCPRCAELAALEREIGRAYCHAVAIERLFDCLSDAFTRYDIKTDQADADAFEMIGEMLHAERTVLRGYHARYRALLAAGAEAAQGGEEAR